MEDDFYIKNKEIIKDCLKTNISKIEQEILLTASPDIKWLFSQFLQMQKELKKMEK